MNGKTITIMQRDIDGQWQFYTIRTYIKSDVLKFDGTRYVKLAFDINPSSIGYYPRQNDILLDAVDLTDGTTISFKYSQNATDGFGIMFLSQFDEETYTFSPLLNLEENVFIPAGSYLPQVLLANAVRSVWGWVVGSNPYLFTQGTLSISSDITRPANYSETTQSTIKDIFTNFIARLRGGWDITFSYTVGDTHPNVIVTGSVTSTGQPTYYVDLEHQPVLDISFTSRNKNSGTSMVIGYLEDGTVYPYYAYLNASLAVVTQPIPASGIITIGNTPRIYYSQIDSASTAKLAESAGSVLDTSIFANDSQIVFKISSDKVLTPNGILIGQFIQVGGLVKDNLKMARMREIDFAENQVIIGDNDDITFGD